MSLVVGISPEERSRAALHVGTILARSSGDELILCAVVPRPWPPSPARVDAEYRAHLERAAEEVLDEARAQLDPDIAATPLVHHAVARVTAAYGAPDGGDELVLAAASVAAQVGAGLRIASFAVRAHPPYTSGIGTQPERAVIDQWAEEIKAASRAALEQVEHLPAVPPELEAEIGYGESWDEALEDIDWQDGDVLVVGSSAMGPIARVFLGSRASKIVRNSSVPAVVVPRGAAAELADQAVRAEAERA